MRDFFRTIKRLHFWILCPVIVLMGLVGWWMATSKIQKETEQRVSKIQSHYRDVQNITGKVPHPNQQVYDGMERLIAARRDEVAEAWKEKYEQQENIFTWEFDGWPGDTKRRFVQRVENLRPIEKTVSFPTDPEPLIITLRHRYRDYIKNELPRLADTIRANWRPSVGQRSGFRQDPMGAEDSGLGRNGSSSIKTNVVEWNPADQAEILMNHFTWDEKGGGRITGPGTAGSGGSANRPTTLDVLYAQEDFWVLQAIMNVIERTNRDSRNPDKPLTTSVNATVKEIDFIRIGKSASRPQGSVQRAAATGAAEGVPGVDRQMPSMMDTYEEGMPSRLDDSTPGGPDPAEGRYVDKNYQALPAATLRSVMASGEAVDPESAYLVVAKRMPVRMRLKVDQRRFNRLLQQCASSELTIEIRQVRIDKGEDSSRRGLGRRPAGPSSRGRRGTSNVEQHAFSYDIDVELYGIIYIYNPVDRKILGYEDEGDSGELTEDNLASADA